MKKAMTREYQKGEQLALSKMAAALVEKMRQISDRPNVLDFGSILDDFSLQTNSLPVPIPKGDYFVCRMTALPDRTDWAVTATADNHFHQMALPDSLAPLRPGDRVLVAWVEDDAVVIDKFMPATAVEVITNG